MITNIAGRLKQVEKDVRLLNSKLAMHMHDYGENVHPLASNGEPGFATSEMMMDRTFVSCNADGSLRDILSLNPGHYYSNANLLSGLPDVITGSELILVDTYGYSDGRKMLRLMEAYTERVWIKNLHAPDGATENAKSVGWILLSGSVQIWAGASSSGTMTFSQTLANFQYLGVMYRSGTGNRYFAKILRDTPGFGLTTNNIPDYSVINILTSEAHFKLTNNDLTFTYNRGNIISGSTATATTDASSNVTVTTLFAING